MSLEIFFFFENKLRSGCDYWRLRLLLTSCRRSGSSGRTSSVCRWWGWHRGWLILIVLSRTTAATAATHVICHVAGCSCDAAAIVVSIWRSVCVTAAHRITRRRGRKCVVVSVKRILLRVCLLLLLLSTRVSRIVVTVYAWTTAVLVLIIDAIAASMMKVTSDGHETYLMVLMMIWYIVVSAMCHQLCLSSKMMVLLL